MYALAAYVLKKYNVISPCQQKSNIEANLENFNKIFIEKDLKIYKDTL